MIICNFFSIEDQFNFGKYNGLSLADVLDIDPSYITWSVLNCTYVIIKIFNSAIVEISTAYPEFIIDKNFETKRLWHLGRDLILCQNNPAVEFYEDEYFDDEEINNYTRCYSRIFVQEVIV